MRAPVVAVTGVRLMDEVNEWNYREQTRRGFERARVAREPKLR
jgi:hypothetical protein